MLRIRSFSVANTAALVFFAGFGAMLLSSVLLLTEVWRFSVLHAGLALMPGPLMAAIFAAPAGRLGAKVGQAPVIAAGGLVFASGFAVNLSLLSATPDYAGSFLPGFLLGGIGVGLVLGPLPAAATMSLPADRFATGTAVFGMARQLGAAIGVAVLVALLADPTLDQLSPISSEAGRSRSGPGWSRDSSGWRSARRRGRGRMRWSRVWRRRRESPAPDAQDVGSSRSSGSRGFAERKRWRSSARERFAS